jgi:hypothetical protein
MPTRQIGDAAHARPESSEQLMGAQSGSAKLSMAQSRSSIETYHVPTLERPELPTKTAEPWWPLRFADVDLTKSIQASATFLTAVEISFTAVCSFSLCT